MVIGKDWAKENGASRLYDEMIKSWLPVFEILTLCVVVDPIGISPKLTALVTKSYLGPSIVTLPELELTLKASPFWSDKTTSDIDIV